MAKYLTVYYTTSGKTKEVAQRLNAAVGGDIFEIVTKDAYPEDFTALVAKAQEEISAKAYPELANSPDISGYDVILVGSPNWCSTLAPPVSSFLKGNVFKGKTVAPFITHGRGGFGQSREDIAELLPDVTIIDALDGVVEEDIEPWITKIKAL
jgi:flavodoxin